MVSEEKIGDVKEFLEDIAKKGAFFSVPLTFGHLNTDVQARLCGALKDDYNNDFAYMVVETDISKYVEAQGLSMTDDAKIKLRLGNESFWFNTQVHSMDIKPEIVKKFPTDKRNYLQVPPSVVRDVRPNHLLRIKLPEKVHRYKREANRLKLAPKEVQLKISPLNREVNDFMKSWNLSLNPKQNSEIKTILNLKDNRELYASEIFNTLYKNILSKKEKILNERGMRPHIEVFSYAKFMYDKKYQYDNKAGARPIFLSTFVKADLDKLLGSKQIQASRGVLQMTMKPFFTSNPSNIHEIKRIYGEWLKENNVDLAEFYLQNEQLRKEFQKGKTPRDTDSYGHIPIIVYDLVGHVHMTGVSKEDFDYFCMLTDAYATLLMEAKEFKVNSEETDIYVRDLGRRGIDILLPDNYSYVTPGARFDGMLYLPGNFGTWDPLKVNLNVTNKKELDPKKYPKSVAYGCSFNLNDNQKKKLDKFFVKKGFNPNL